MSLGGKSNPVLEVRVHRADLTPALTALCAGYERGAWRTELLVDNLIEWIPEFALTREELQGLTPGTMVPLMRKALLAIYTTQRFERRGELGELLLHAILREQRRTIPAISKIFYKDGTNETVKGFDAVHVVDADGELELWLGEVKLYEDIKTAIRDVIKEVNEHARTSYLRAEFLAIANKVDSHWPHAERLKLLLDPTTSLDKVFARACVPVVLGYDSAAVSAHTKVTEEYKRTLEVEALRHHSSFAKGPLPKEVRIELFLVPLKSKAALVAAFDRRLKLWQNL